MKMPISALSVSTVVLLIIGYCTGNETILDFGYSFLSGSLVGVLCNIAISDYYRKKDKRKSMHNAKLLIEKEKAEAQRKDLQAIVEYSMELVASLKAFFDSNPVLSNTKKLEGYYDLCKVAFMRPQGMTQIDGLFPQESFDVIGQQLRKYEQIERVIEAKEFSKIDLPALALDVLGFVSTCMPFNGEIVEHIRELDQKIQY